MKKAKIHYSKDTIEMIKKVLKVNSLEEVLYKEYPDDAKGFDYNRDHIKIFSKMYTGSVRLFRGLFYTKKEFEEDIKKKLSIQIPK